MRNMRKSTIHLTFLWKSEHLLPPSLPQSNLELIDLLGRRFSTEVRQPSAVHPPATAACPREAPLRPLTWGSYAIWQFFFFFKQTLIMPCKQELLPDYQTAQSPYWRSLFLDDDAIIQ